MDCGSRILITYEHHGLPEVLWKAVFACEVFAFEERSQAARISTICRKTLLLFSILIAVTGLSMVIYSLSQLKKDQLINSSNSAVGISGLIILIAGVVSFKFNFISFEESRLHSERIDSNVQV